MPVCKFYLQGNCRYGDRCYNEHPRHSSLNRNQRTEWANNGRRNRFDDQHRYQNYGYNDAQQYYDDDYHEEQKHYHNKGKKSWQNKKHQQPAFFSNFSSSNSRSSGSGSRRDAYHWSAEDNSYKGNQFAPLNKEKKPETDLESLFLMIKNDMKIWAESGMWPFSCYSCNKDSPCIEGLPDISPEEMRVVASLHPKHYQKIWDDTEVNHCKVKDDLFEMSDHTKRNLTFQMHNQKSNPSRELNFPNWYGLEFNFENNKVEPSLQTVSLPMAQSFPPAVAKTPASKNSLFTSTTDVSGFSIQQVASVPSNAQPTPNMFKAVENRNLSESHEVYTPHILLNDNEKTEFENSKFTLGKIPTKPPPIEFCR